MLKGVSASEAAFLHLKTQTGWNGLAENAAGLSLWKKQFIVSRSRTDGRTADACLFSSLGAAIFFQSCGRCLFSFWSSDEDGSTWMRIVSRFSPAPAGSAATRGGTNPLRAPGKTLS